MRNLQCQQGMSRDGLAGKFPATSILFVKPDVKALQIPSPGSFACLSGGAGSEITFDCDRKAIDRDLTHSVVSGMQEVRMQLKWREHALPALFISGTLIMPLYPHS